jgi:hypothetical protein
MNHSELLFNLLRSISKLRHDNTVPHGVGWDQKESSALTDVTSRNAILDRSGFHLGKREGFASET